MGWRRRRVTHRLNLAANPDVDYGASRLTHPTLRLSLPAELPRLNERRDAFAERIQNRQLLREAERGSLPPPGRFPGKDVRNIRIAGIPVAHAVKLGCAKRIFNLGLRAKAQPAADQLVSLQNVFEREQIDRALLQESLHARQILEPCKPASSPNKATRNPGLLCCA